MGEGILKKYTVDRIGRFNNVIFTGSVSYLKIQDYLSICDILVSPHGLQPDGKEFIGSPTKLFEYMAMGKSIVASELGQIGEILKDNETAILVEPGNIEDLSGGILRLVYDEKLRLRLGSNAAREIQSKYTWGGNIKRLLSFIAVKKIAS
jgi:glycosyltransferase involved in cell wall biosynthesis